jgi:Ser/Thr protein kinase RdoA (MazF antagonist)
MSETGNRRDSFDPPELVAVLSHYNIGVIRSAKEFTLGSRRAPKLLLDTPNGHFLLKRRAPGRDDPPRVAFAHALVTHLRAHGLPVPGLVKRCDEDETILELSGRLYEVWEFVPGQRYKGDLDQTHDAGRTLARYHRAVADFESDWTPPVRSYHDAPNVRAGLNAIPSVTSGHDSVVGQEAELLSVTQRLYEQYDDAVERTAASAIRKWPATTCHGDWHPGNLLYADGRVCAVLDFDTVRHAPALIDVAYGMLQFSILRDTSAPREWPEFFDESRMRRFFMGYAESARIPPAQRQVIPDLMVEALIAEVALPIAATGSFGHLPGFGVLKMVARKVGWLLENGDHLRAWLAE